jgi:hypothetical protein
MSERWRRGLRELDTLEPSPDVWSRALALSAEERRPDISADGRHRILTLAVAIVVAAGGLGAGFFALRGLETEPGAGALVTYRYPTGAWEITYPERFRQGTIPWEFVRPSVEGIWIANFDSPSFSDRTIGALIQLPHEGVIVLVYQILGEPDYSPRERDSSFPISFEDLKVERGLQPEAPRVATLVANGEAYRIEVFMGPEASEEDRGAAVDIVSSFRILPLEEGTTTGRQLTFFVLGPPDRYPVGSVTLFDQTSLPRSEHADPFPFYLVHVPGGFYALAWPGDRYGKDCAVAFDSASREFTCPNGARWALDGSVISKPEPGLPEDPLSVLLVRISLDGNLLVSPTVFSSDTELDLQMTSG